MSDMDRRGFLGVFATLFGLPGLATITDPVLRGAAGTWRNVGASADLQPGVPQPFSYEVQSGWEKRKESGFLVRKDDEVVAFSARCTHLGCKVRHKKGEFFCPCHAGAFDVDGRPKKKPVTEPMIRLEVRERDGKIQVRA